MNTIEEINPKDDVMFHLLFGKKGNEDLLMDLLEGILEIKVEDIELDVDNIMIGDTLEEKIGILDIRAKINGGEQVNIEMQIRNKNNMIKRTMYYVSKMYANQLKKGDEYKKLKKTIAINILDYEMLDTKSYHSKWKLREEKERNKILTEDIEIHIIELPKFRRDVKGCKKKIEQWLYFIDNRDKEMVEMSVIANENVARAMNQVKIRRTHSAIVRKQRLEIARLDRLSEMNEMKEELKPKIVEEIKEELKPKIEEEMKEELKPKIEEEMKEELKPKIEEEMKEELKPKIEEKLKEELKQEIMEKIREETKQEMETKMKSIDEFCKTHNIVIEDTK